MKLFLCSYIRKCLEFRCWDFWWCLFFLCTFLYCFLNSQIPVLQNPLKGHRMSLGFSLLRGRLGAKGGANVPASHIAVSLRLCALPLLSVPTYRHFWVSPHGLYNGQEGMADLLSCHQPKTRRYLKWGHAPASETLTLLWVCLGCKMFVLKP